MSLGWIILLVACVALARTLAAWLRARKMSNKGRRHVRTPHRKLSRNKVPSSSVPDGKRCLEIAGGPLDLMADYDVSHPYWYIAVEDD